MIAQGTGRKHRRRWSTPWTGGPALWRRNEPGRLRSERFLGFSNRLALGPADRGPGHRRGCAAQTAAPRLFTSATGSVNRISPGVYRTDPSKMLPQTSQWAMGRLIVSLTRQAFRDNTPAEGPFQEKVNQRIIIVARAVGAKLDRSLNVDSRAVLDRSVESQLLHSRVMRQTATPNRRRTINWKGTETMSWMAVFISHLLPVVLLPLLPVVERVRRPSRSEPIPIRRRISERERTRC